MIILLIVCLLLVSLGLIFGFSYLAYRKRGLSHDAEFVRKMLPCVDCGMCGEENCKNFSLKVAHGKREPEECKIIKPENSEKIKYYFKPTYNQSSRLVAFVKCKGGCRAEDKYIYDGAKNCAIEETLHSGSKACKYACLGCGDCVHACRFRALKINKRGVAEVIRSKCTGCGECVGVCPNSVITMKKLELSVGIVCNNQANEPGIEKKCEVGCIHCEKCVNICPVGAISMQDNIPVIDPGKCIECYRCVASCPNHVISRL